jgi:hypothetical protein
MPIGLSNDQMNQLRQCAAALPVELRSGLLELVAGDLGGAGRVSDAAFQRALSFAVAQLPAGDGAGTFTCSR